MADGYLNNQWLNASVFNDLKTPQKLNNDEIVMHGSSKVAMGWRVNTDAQLGEYIHHSGVTSGARSIVLMIPERNLSIAIVSNSAWIAATEATALSFLKMKLVNTEENTQRHTVCERIKYLKQYSGQFAEESVKGYLAKVKTGPKVSTCSFDLVTRNNQLGRWLSSNRGFDSGPVAGLVIKNQVFLISAIGIFKASLVDNEDNLSLEAKLGRRKLTIDLN